MVKFYSLNVRGLRERRKRRDIFSFLKRKEYDVIFIQESHSTPEIEELWKKEWGGEISFNHFNSRARGTMILYRAGAKISHLWVDDEGRIVINTLTINDTQYTCINIYAPNIDSERITFFQNLSSIIMSKCPTGNVVMAGDFNVTIKKNDKKFGTISVQKSVSNLNQILEEFKLIDIWREQHASTQKFTWSRQKPKVMCRLDYFFISKNLVTNCKKSQILESVHTDHKLISLELSEMMKQTRGPGFYKFNNSLLQNQNYINEMTQLIQDKKQEYSNMADKRVAWDLIKFHIRSKSIQMSKKIAREKRKLEDELLNKCDKLYSKLCESGLDSKEEEEYMNCKSVLEDINHYKEQGAHIRSRTDFIEKNEKSNHYFFNKEKESYVKKTVEKLKIGDHYVTDPLKILDELNNFYSTLYQSRNPPLHEQLFKNMLNVEGLGILSENEKEQCEGPLTVEEVKRALDRMQSGKSPGCDGLTSDFYKFFWPLLGDFLVDTLNFAAEKGEMSQSQKRGIITLLQKKNKDPELIKNWRPVSLTNVDYKLLTKSLAIRTELLTPKLIHENQTGFVKGRFIGENIRLIEDISNKLNLERRTGFLLMLDFEKAFDSVEWGYMDTILGKFNFGLSFRNWVKICYTNITSTVINNGFTNGWFSIFRGVRQGCPLSTFLFILCVELLAHLIRNDHDISGIKFDNLTYKISLFADDATCLLSDVASIGRVFALTERFSIYSGLKLNMEKSLLVFLGPWKRKPIIPHNVTIVTGSFNILGIELGVDKIACNRTNILNKIDSMKVKLNIWSQRGLTLLGKVLIAKSMGMSNLIYSLSCVLSKDKDIKHAQTIINKFIWSNKVSRIKHTTLMSDFDSSGIRSPDINSMQKSLRLAWLSRLWDKKLCNYLVHKDFDRYGGLNIILHSDFDAKLMYIPVFYKELLLYFSEFHDQSIYGGMLWNNKNLTFGGQSIYKREWHNHGIIYIKDLLGLNNKILQISEIKDKFGLNYIDVIWYNGLKIVLNKWLKNQDHHKFLQNDYIVDIDSAVFKVRESIINVKKAKCKDYYNVLLEMKIEKPVSLVYWESVGLNDETKILQSLAIYRKATRETYLLAMQLKIIHNVIATNKKKMDWKIEDSSTCSYCREIETVFHYFWECKFTKDIIKNCLRVLKLQNVNWDKWEFIFGKDDLAIDNLTIIIKQYIYYLRLNAKSFNDKQFIGELRIRWIADRSKLNDDRLKAKWHTIHHITMDDFNNTIL